MRVLIGVVIVAALATSALAQRTQDVVRRPQLGPNTDSNSALAYFTYGAHVFLRNPRDASDAFYWASRLDPTHAGALYARHMAWFLIGNNFRNYTRRDKRLEQSGERKLVDSLARAARLRDPFVRVKVEQFIRSRTFGAVSPSEIFHAREPMQKAWLHMLDGNYYESARYLGAVIAKDSTDVVAYLARADVHYLASQYDSAAADLAHAIAIISRRQDEKLVLLYVPKSMLEYSMGHALLMQNDVAGAKAAYGRALGEDLSFYMAHARLAEIAVLERDTTTALSEYEIALQLNGGDVVLRQEYGEMLLKTGKYDEAAAQFRKAIDVEPYYPAPYLSLGAIEDANGNEAKAKELLEQFVARAPQDDPTLPRVRLKIAALGGGKP